MNVFCRLSLLSLVLLLTGCAAMTVPPHPDQLSFPPLVFQMPEVDRSRMDNGITLYLQEDHELPLVEITALVGFGSIGMPVEKAGLASLFAMTLESGGAGSRGPESMEMALEQLAAQLDVSVDTYTTTLNLSLRAEDLQIGLEILVDLLRHPGFDSQRLEVARRRLLESIRRRDDEPSSLASRLLNEAIYGGHPLGVSPSQESVDRVRREDLLAFHRSTFAPDSLKLAVTGDFDRSELLPLLQGALGDWQGQIDRPQPLPALHGEGGGRIIVAHKDLPQTTILMGHLGIDKDDPDLFAVRVMNYILGGGGFNSRLMREVRSNRGLAYSVYSYYQIGRRLPGPFIAGSETKTTSVPEVLELMQNIFGQMREGPVDEHALQLAKESLVNSFVFAFTDTHSVVSRKMVLDHFDYPEDYLETYRDRVMEVSATDVLRAARQHLHPERMKVVLVGDGTDFATALKNLALPLEKASVGR